MGKDALAPTLITATCSHLRLWWSMLHEDSMRSDQRLAPIRNIARTARSAHHGLTFRRIIIDQG